MVEGTTHQLYPHRELHPALSPAHHKHTYPPAATTPLTACVIMCPASSTVTLASLLSLVCASPILLLVTLIKKIRKPFYLVSVMALVILYMIHQYQSLKRWNSSLCDFWHNQNHKIRLNTNIMPVFTSSCPSSAIIKWKPIKLNP